MWQCVCVCNCVSLTDRDRDESEERGQKIWCNVRIVLTEIDIDRRSEQDRYHRSQYTVVKKVEKEVVRRFKR